MEKLDDIILKYFEENSEPVRNRSSDEPTAHDFCRYIRGELKGALAEKMAEFIASHRWAQDMVLDVSEALSSAEHAAVPAHVEDRARSCFHGTKQAAGRKHSFPIAGLHLWLVLSIACFGASFFIPRFFMQFLAAGVLFGVKWIVEHRARKTQIMIYRALEDKESGVSQPNREKSFRR